MLANRALVGVVPATQAIFQIVIELGQATGAGHYILLAEPRRLRVEREPLEEARNGVRDHTPIPLQLNGFKLNGSNGDHCGRKGGNQANKT